MNSLSRALVLGLCCLTSLTARAQADGFIPAPMPSPAPLPLPLPAGPLQPLPTDPIKLGFQFHGDFQGFVTGAGASSFGVNASVGLGLNRLAILLTPSITLAGSVTAFALGLNVRIYFKNRQQGVLVGFLKPSALVGTVSSGFSSSAVYGGLGLGGGGEYLLTRNLGITAELGITFSSLGFSAGGAPAGFGALTTVGSVGVMLHQ